LFNLVVLLPTRAQRRDGSRLECPSRHSRAAPNSFTRSGPDGRNAKAVVTETADGYALILLGGVDWR
jgi:hypothetical protein